MTNNEAWAGASFIECGKNCIGMISIHVIIQISRHWKCNLTALARIIWSYVPVPVDDNEAWADTSVIECGTIRSCVGMISIHMIIQISPHWKSNSTALARMIWSYVPVPVDDNEAWADTSVIECGTIRSCVGMANQTWRRNTIEYNLIQLKPSIWRTYSMQKKAPQRSSNVVRLKKLWGWILIDKY